MMKTLILTWMTVFAVASIADEIEKTKPQPVAINVTNRRPLPEIHNVRQLRTYANESDYYLTVNLREGMRVSFSASYGIGGEAGQAHGVIVRHDGKYLFKQLDNVTGQLLLPPGLAFNSGKKVSLWDIEEYMNLINRVAYSEPNRYSNTAHNIYAKPVAALVDFKGGTAGKTVMYQDSMELVFHKSVGNRSSSDAKIYYAKGIGPVALEFRENMSPSGTFKIYIGE